MRLLKSMCVGIFMVLAAQHAAASPIAFSFVTDLFDVDPEGNPYGVAEGDSSVLTVIVDNGGIGFLNQTWGFADIMSAEWSSGTYSAFWDDASTTWYDDIQNPLFATDAGGIVTEALFQGSSSFTGVDNGGNSAYLNQNGPTTSGGYLFTTPNFHDVPEGWTVDNASDVPLPTTAWLFVSALLGLSGVGRCKRA